MRWSKYKAKKVKVDGMTFDSQKEYQRWLDLQRMEKMGVISDLERQVEYVLIPSQKGKTRNERAVKYIADFRYFDYSGFQVVEDVKGVKTPDYIIKRKLMLHLYGIEIKET